MVKGVYNPKAVIPHAASLHQASAHCGPSVQRLLDGGVERNLVQCVAAVNAHGKIAAVFAHLCGKTGAEQYGGRCKRCS